MLGSEPAQSPQKPRRVIIDDCPSPLPTLAIIAGAHSSTTMGTQTGAQDEQVLPTESRIKQKGRLKIEREAGIKPRRIKKHVEDGNDNCGDDLSGLGQDLMAT
eukprot:913641-Pyramimonas_sp.AAC.1